MAPSIMSLGVWRMTKNVPHFSQPWAWLFCDFPTGILIGIFVACANKLILPFKIGSKTLSVTCGDSSPIGRAKGVCNHVHGYKKQSVSVMIRSVHFYSLPPDRQRPFTLYSSASSHSFSLNPVKTLPFSRTSTGRLTSIPSEASRRSCSSSDMAGSRSFSSSARYC